jgi:hypothetical protein
MARAVRAEGLQAKMTILYAPERAKERAKERPIPREAMAMEIVFPLYVFGAREGNTYG